MLLEAAKKASGRDDEELLALSGPLFDGLYEYRKRALLTGREPA